MIKLRLTKKLIVATTSFLLLTMGSALAAPLSQTQSQLNKSKQLYNDAVKKVESLEIEVEKLDSQIENAMAALNDTNKKIDASKQAITKTAGEIKTIEKNINDEQKLFGERMEALYINGSTSYLDVLFEAKSFGDFMSRIDTVKTIMEYDKKIVDGLNTQKATLATKKKGLEKEQAGLVTLQTQSKNKVAELNDKKKEQGTVIASLKTQTQQYAAQIRAYQDAVSQSLSESNNNSGSSNSSSKPDNNNSSSSSSSSSSSGSNSSSKPSTGGSTKPNVPNRGDGSGSAMDVVNYARQFKGTPYVWGGTTPSGFDCSGFTSYVYRNAAGISIPRTSGSQAGVGTYIGSKSDLQPGDLVFFGSPTHHVGIYTGNGNYIHSPRTGDVVKEVPMSRSDFTHGRRLL